VLEKIGQQNQEFSKEESTEGETEEEAEEEEEEEHLLLKIEDPSQVSPTDAKLFIRKLKQKRVSLKDLRKSICGSLKHLGAELYSSPTHFLHEIIQNAEDNIYLPQAEPRLKITLDKRRQELVGKRAEHFVCKLLEYNYYPQFSPFIHWKSSTRKLVYPHAIPGIDDSCGYDFEVVDSKRLFTARDVTEKHPKKCYIEVKGVAGEWDGVFHLSANEVRKRDSLLMAQEAYIIVIVSHAAPGDDQIGIAAVIDWTAHPNIIELDPESYWARYAAQHHIERERVGAVSSLGREGGTNAAEDRRGPGCNRNDRRQMSSTSSSSSFTASSASGRSARASARSATPPLIRLFLIFLLFFFLQEFF
jgi:hypothetical protein